MTAGVDAFLAAVVEQDRAGAKHVLEGEPAIAATSLHVAAVLGHSDDARRLIDENRARVSERLGEMGGDPLLYLCYSPFHGESRARDAGLLDTARVLLDAGADPNTRDSRHNVPALYAVTGERSVLPLATLLLDAGANPTDGESIFHAAERCHVDAMELLLARGCDLNFTGDWGNTALTFLLSWYTLGAGSRAHRGFAWLLAHGADPNVRTGRARETALHIAARRGQSPDVVQALLEHGADVNAEREDRCTAWLLARRGGFDALATLLENAGAEPRRLSPLDQLLAACNRGDAAEAARLASPDFSAAVNATDEFGTTALHHAAFMGRAPEVRAWIAAGADLAIRDRQHHATPLGWAQFAAETQPDPAGDYPACIAALKAAGGS